MKRNESIRQISGSVQKRVQEYQNKQQFAARPTVPVRTTRIKPCFRLLLLAVSASPAILFWYITHSVVITLTMIFFGCLAVGLISEQTLVKILSRGRKR